MVGAEEVAMSNQNGPNWYPSKQFTHTPEVPGAPAPSASRPADGRPTPTGPVRRFVQRLLGRSS